MKVNDVMVPHSTSTGYLLNCCIDIQSLRLCFNGINDEILSIIQQSAPLLYQLMIETKAIQGGYEWNGMGWVMI